MWDLINVSYILCLRWEISSFLLDAQTVGSPLVGSTWQIIEYIPSYPPYLETISYNLILRTYSTDY
jgi:hypothetical protein